MYDRSKDQWEEFESSFENLTLKEAWKNKESIDSWRHQRMRDGVSALINLWPKASWLTVGDGRYGSDAQFLKKEGAKHVHASDITDTLLDKAFKENLFDDFSSQNAESIKFEDGKFDFVYCKESYHHFPRASLALHELYRVARKGVILIEPRDRVIDNAFFSWIFRLIRVLVGRPLISHSFETVGNYVFTISEAEMSKFLLGQHKTLLAVKEIDDYYLKGVEFTPLHGGSIKDRIFRFRFFGGFLLKKLLTKILLKKSSLLSVILFKAGISKDDMNKMKSFGWKFRHLPKNPYLEKGQ